MGIPIYLECSLWGVVARSRGVSQFFANLGETLDVKDFGIEEFISQGNTVVVLGYEKVQVKSTGSEYKNEWVHVWKLKEGKVTKVRTYNDTATAAAAFQGT
jgi:ketosteroid isomerase-like protein